MGLSIGGTWTSTTASGASPPFLHLSSHSCSYSLTCLLCRHGNALGPVQGVGYINELLARLTSTPVSDNTSTNHTLDSDPATFPLNRTVYADFSHDNLMIPVFAAMGLFPTDPLDPTGAESHAGGVWNVSRMVPFAGKMVVERLTCGEGYTGDEGRYVRVLVNQGVQPLAFCGASGDGVCSLDAFVESQAFARSGGNGTWDTCFESAAA